ncbi:carboxymuconolactone decarboxylase family protein [soil metagenome]
MTATTTNERLSARNFKKHLPGMVPATVALGASIAPAGLEPELIELVNLRTSQINGCAYCVQMHTEELRGMGVSQAKLTLVVAWEEAGIFSEREQAALSWAETITLIAQDHVPAAKYEAARAVFSELELVGLTTAIAAMNVWNRIAVTFRYAPEI